MLQLIKALKISFEHAIALLIFVISMSLFNNTNFLQAQTNNKILSAGVGKQPVAIIPTKAAGSLEINSDTLNIICLGQDLNFNGVLDEGEEATSWWKIEGVSKAITQTPDDKGVVLVPARKVMDFGFNFDGFFPFRNRTINKYDEIPAFLGNMLPIIKKDKIEFYNLSTEKNMMSLEVKGAKSVGMYKNFLVVAVREYAQPGDYIPSDNYIVLFKNNGPAGFNVMDTIKTGDIVQRVIPYSYKNGDKVEEAIAVLCEGKGGAASTVEIYKAVGGFDAAERKFEKVTFDVGKMANDLVLHRFENTDNEVIAQVLFIPASGKVFAINANTLTREIPKDILDSNEIDFLPNESAREISIVENQTINGGMQKKYAAYISTYAGKIYYIEDICKTKEMKTYETNGIAEAVVGFSKDNLLYAYTSVYKDLTTYAANDTVFIHTSVLVGIDANNNNNNILTFPNPTKGNLNILANNDEEVKKIEITNIEGKIIQEINQFQNINGIINININPNIKAGQYIIKIETKNGIKNQNIILE